MSLTDVKQSYNFIDLFAGAGGLSEGFLQAGFTPIAHVEMNKFAAKRAIMRQTAKFFEC